MQAKSVNALFIVIFIVFPRVLKTGFSQVIYLIA